MKTFHSRLTGLALGLALAAGVLAPTPQANAAANPAAGANTATVASVTGGATVRDSSGKSMALTKGSKISQGATINTASGSEVTLQIQGVGRVNVRENSSINLSKLVKRQSASETTIDVRKGSILGDIKKLSAASKFDVKTAKGVAGIRGTKFVVFAIGIFKCAEGQLQVVLFAINPTTGQPAAFTLNAGQEGDASNGAPNVTVTQLSQGELNQIIQEADGGVLLLLRQPVVIDVQPVVTGLLGEQDTNGGGERGSSGSNSGKGSKGT